MNLLSAIDALNLKVYNCEGQDIKEYLKSQRSCIFESGTYSWTEVEIKSIKTNPGKYL